MADYFDPAKTAYENIEKLKTRLKDGDLDFQKFEEESKKIYATIFALRIAVNSKEGSASSLKVKADQNVFKTNYDMLMKSEAFDAFIKEKGTDGINALIAKGHGGEAEKAFREHMMKTPRLGKELPARFMPTANVRIESLQKELESEKKADSEKAIRIYSEIFRARRSVGAQHKNSQNKNRLAMQIPGANYAITPDFEKSETFKTFVKEKGEDLKKLIGKGHGGEAERFYRDYVKELDHIPEDVPISYMPTAKDRIDALQEKIKSKEFEQYSEEKKNAIYTELYAARCCIGAERGKEKTLERYPDPKNLNAWVKYWNKSTTFQEFLKKDPKAIKDAATSGHGGAMEDKLKEHILNSDHIRDDTWKQYMPTAEDRTRSIQTLIDSKLFLNLSSEKKAEYYCELMATRQSVNAVRKDKKSLAPQLDPKKVSDLYDKWNKCETFKTYLSKNPIDAMKAATSGHGGALEDAFKDYVKNLDHIPADVPQGYLPTAEERLEVLQKKVKSTTDPKLRADLYKEMMATRMAAQAIRKTPSTLSKPVDPVKLNEAYEKLNKSKSLKNFLEKTPAAELKDAATAGHGGALEDKYTEYAVNRAYQLGKVPSGVPDRYRPTPDQLTKKFQTEIQSNLKTKDEKWFKDNSDQIRKETAALLYMKQVNAEKSTDVGRKSLMSHDKMEEGITKILTDPKFNNMYKELGPKKTAQLASQEKMTALVKKYQEAKGAEPELQQPAPNNPVLQNPNRQQPIRQQQPRQLEV